MDTKIISCRGGAQSRKIIFLDIRAFFDYNERHSGCVLGLPAYWSALLARFRGVCNRTNRESAWMAFKRSAVRSRLSPPKSSWNLTISGLFLYFPLQRIDRIFAVMRPDPDLTQTGAKMRWIYRDLFDKTARVSLFSRIFWTFERRLQLAAAALVLGSDRVADGVSDRVCRTLFHTRRRVDIGAEGESCAEMSQRFWKRPHIHAAF